MRFIKKRNENLLIEEFIKILKGEIIKKEREKKVKFCFNWRVKSKEIVQKTV